MLDTVGAVSEPEEKSVSQCPLDSALIRLLPFLWLELLLLFTIMVLLLFMGWLLELSALSESESESSSFESLDDDELSSPIYIKAWMWTLSLRKRVLSGSGLTSSRAFWGCCWWWCCCCCCCNDAPDAFGIDVEADKVFKLLLALRLLLLLLLYTDDGGWLLAKLSSNKLGILGNVCCVLLAFHLRYMAREKGEEMVD